MLCLVLNVSSDVDGLIHTTSSDYHLNVSSDVDGLIHTTSSLYVFTCIVHMRFSILKTCFIMNPRFIKSLSSL